MALLKPSLGRSPATVYGLMEATSNRKQRSFSSQAHGRHKKKPKRGYGRPRRMPPPSSRIGSIVMCAIIVVMAAFLGEVLLYNTFIPKDYFSTLAAKAFGRGDMVAAVVDSVMIGILLTHFWLDSFFWRFKKPEPRQWMLNWYAFLFSSRKP